MRAVAMKDLWPFGLGKTDAAVSRDADRLLRTHGEQAYDTAGLYAWREDIGLLYTPKPGHWQRVKHEIASRDGFGSMPAVDTSARIQRLHLM